MRKWLSLRPHAFIHLLLSLIFDFRSVTAVDWTVILIIKSHYRAKFVPVSLVGVSSIEHGHPNIYGVGFLCTYLPCLVCKNEQCCR